MERTNFKHISAFDSPGESPGYLLWHVSTKWRSSIEDVLKAVQLTHPQFVILATLAWLTKDGDKVSQVTIGKMAGLDPNTISQILRTLEKKKFIKRVHSVDERSKNSILTSDGNSILSQALPLVEQADKKFFESLRNNDINTLKKLFQKLIL
jgi:DNA-binding MarR family transcriptional regulator